MKLSHLALGLLLAVSLFSSCREEPRQINYDYAFIQSRNVQCSPNTPKRALAGVLPFLTGEEPEVEINHPRYLPAGKTSDLPRILPNDNRVPAGLQTEQRLDLELEVTWGDFRMETDNRPGLKLAAIGEKGKAATIPAPLIRIPEGTVIRARITNTLPDSTITVYGLQKRPYTVPDSLLVHPGEFGEVTFEAGAPGTYMYWVKLGAGHPNEGFFSNEEEQLAGAFIVDPKKGSPDDRVFVMNIFSNQNKEEDANPKWVESLTINGKSWPFTERLTPSVGDTLTWRVINASQRAHPMHLHGFYFNVLERGTVGSSTILPEDQRPMVVTESQSGRNTMTMQWVPQRPGNWLFHCHLSFHVSSELRLPEADKLDPEGSHQHMAGLALGIQIQDGGTDLISRGDPRHLTMYANKGDNDRVSFDWEATKARDSFAHGPVLILNQYQSTYVTLKNEMDYGTSVHWHGLEIDSWADGVPNWSNSDGKRSPVIEPGEEFTYKLSLMRPGTFVYHSHLEDIKQLTKGLYGPLIVLGEDETFDPGHDHIYTLGWKTPNLKSAHDLDLNGWDEIPVQQARAGEAHRLRLINIGLAGKCKISVRKDDMAIPLRTLAKDGADLPSRQQEMVEASPMVDVGETADVEFTPSEPGTYELVVNYIFAEWKQTWVVQ